MVAKGPLRAIFNEHLKIELLDFEATSHEEYLVRKDLVEAARPLHEWQKEWHKMNTPADDKQSPELSKKKTKQLKSPPNPPPEIDIPESKVKVHGLTPNVFRFLEVGSADEYFLEPALT